VAQALASGTRAQRELQQLRDDLRRKSSSQFADDMRQMRAEARELSRKQEVNVAKQMEALNDNQRKTLSDSGERQEAIDQLARQKGRLTNLVEHATQVSQQSETAEPLLSHNCMTRSAKPVRTTSRT